MAPSDGGHPPAAGNDPEYMENLSYFLWEGIQVTAALTGHARGADTVASQAGFSSQMDTP